MFVPLPVNYLKSFNMRLSQSWIQNCESRQNSKTDTTDYRDVGFELITCSQGCLCMIMTSFFLFVSFLFSMKCSELFSFFLANRRQTFYLPFAVQTHKLLMLKLHQISALLSLSGNPAVRSVKFDKMTDTFISLQLTLCQILHSCITISPISWL